MIQKSNIPKLKMSAYGDILDSQLSLISGAAKKILKANTFVF